jgi:hypothetical protein
MIDCPKQLFVEAFQFENCLLAASIAFQLSEIMDRSWKAVRASLPATSLLSKNELYQLEK